MTTSPAECAIRAFGSIRKTAKAVNRTPGAVSFWKKTGHIPTEVLPTILRYAVLNHLPLTAEDLILGRE